METRNSNIEINRSNVLVLDGGGVRGLSSLLILQALMEEINSEVAKRVSSSHVELHPFHVFQLVAGTSTGGLIALMLGKIGLTASECIKEYEKLSEIIFGKKHFRGIMSMGLANAKYSGKGLRKCVRNLLREHGLSEDLAMDKDAAKTACAVICREHCKPSQYSELLRKAVPICSLPCKTQVECTVCEAARATSAAPTYFPVMNINGRYFTDGGFEHNNPSFAIYFHYTSGQRKKSTKPGRPAPDYSPHPTLDCSSVRFTNIGTGARLDDQKIGKRDRLADLIPRIIRRGVFLKTTLKEIAVNSQQTVDTMEQFADLSPNLFKYERLDADEGVSDIPLDRYDALDEIREKTNLYLAKDATREQLKEVGKDIALDYLRIQPNQQESSQTGRRIVNNTYLEAGTVSTRGSSSVSTAQSNQGIDSVENYTTQVIDAKYDDSTFNDAKIVTEVT